MSSIVFYKLENGKEERWAGEEDRMWMSSKLHEYTYICTRARDERIEQRRSVTSIRKQCTRRRRLFLLQFFSIVSLVIVIATNCFSFYVSILIVSYFTFAAVQSLQLD